MEQRLLRSKLLFEATPAALESTPLEQLRYEQMAFAAVRRASERKQTQKFINEIADSLDSQFRWVGQTDPEDVRHLSLTVSSFQEQYQARHQKAPSSQQVYRHVRMRVETTEPTAQDERAVLLCEALMNGDVRNGTLPLLPRASV